MSKKSLWFHVKSGEIIAKYGIIHHDVFSYTAQGREWFPSEWLFELIVYYTQQLFGFASIRFLIAGIITLQIVTFFIILRRVFSLNRIVSFTLCFLFFVSVSDFLTARPHILAYTFLLINLFFMLLYYFKSKNFLW